MGCQMWKGVRIMQLEDLELMVKSAEKLKHILQDIEELNKRNEKKFIPASTNDRLLTIPDVAERLQTSKQNVYELLRKGFLPYLIIGDKKVRESALVKFMADCEGYNANGSELKKIS